MTPEELAALRRELSRQIVSTLVGLFYGLDQYRDADAARFVEQALPILRAGQITMAQLVAQYLAGVAGAAEGVPPGAEVPIIIPEATIIDLREDDGLAVLDIPAGSRARVDTVVERAPMTPAERMREVYRRPFATLYTELSKDPTDMTHAVESAGNRLAEIVEMDLQQTYSVANREGMARMSTEPLYWRRLPIGEENCALCILASTVKYKRGDLNPIHPGCDCGVAPVTDRDQDPIDEDGMYDRVHAAAEEATGSVDLGGRGVDYRKIRTNITVSHGEHPAPLLVRPVDHFTDLSEVVTNVESETDSP